MRVQAGHTKSMFSAAHPACPIRPVKRRGNSVEPQLAALGPAKSVNVGTYPEHRGPFPDSIPVRSARAYCRDSVGRWYLFQDRAIWPDLQGGSANEVGELDRRPFWIVRPKWWERWYPRNSGLWWRLPKAQRDKLPPRIRRWLGDPHISNVRMPRVRRP